MTVRDATLEDVDAITLMIQNAMVLDFKLIPDRVKIKHIVTQAVSSKMHHLQVGYDGDKLTGCILVGTGDFDFAKKMMGQISYFNFQNLAQGTELVQNMMEWVRSRKAVQLVTFSVPYFTFGHDLLEREGFRSTGSLLHWRRQWDFSQKSGKASKKA